MLSFCTCPSHEVRKGEDIDAVKRLEAAQESPAAPAQKRPAVQQVAAAPQVAVSNAKELIEEQQQKILSEKRERFADRCATSRHLDVDGTSKSSLDVGARENIDPEHGLRRPESVNTSLGAVEERYYIVKKLGEGSFGTVMRVESKISKEHFAMKNIPVKNLKDVSRFEKELEVSRQLKHPHIIRLFEAFREGEQYHLIMEFSDGGDLFEKVRHTRRKHDHHMIMGLDSSHVAQYAWQMLTGIAYCHHYHFAHRDVKPENYLLQAEKHGGALKLIDFGLSRMYAKDQKMHSRVGTPHYVAPEVINNKVKGYTSRCDLWSIGVAIWHMSVGELPFTAASQQEILKMVVRGSYQFKPHLWDIHSHPQELKDLIASLLQTDPASRPAAKDIVASNAWLIQHGDPRKGHSSSKSCCAIS